MTQEREFKLWPARYKAYRIEVFESKRLQNWLTVNDVRKVVPSLRKDVLLQKEYITGVEQIDTSKRLFFNEKTLVAELKRNRSQEALLFLAWFERTVIYPARRKREGLPALPTITKSKVYDDKGTEVLPDESNLHIPVRLPLESHKVLTANERVPVITVVQSQSLGKKVFLPFVLIWRGKMDLKETLIGGGLLAVMFGLAIDMFIDAVGSTENYQGDFLFRQWLIALTVLFSAIGPIWWCVGLMRCALRYQREHRGAIRALLAFIGGASIMLSSTASTLTSSGEWLSGWLDELLNKSAVVEVIHDPILGRIVLRGEMGFGSYKVLQSALLMKPKLSLIQVESPGGYVIEGMAMAKLIQSNGLDTVSMEKCASACTLLLAAGNERYLGPMARVGFHRSGVFGQAPSGGWTSTEYTIAAYYKSRGANPEFIKLALDTPFNRIWIPDHNMMFEAGYASKMWSERKAEY